MPGDEHSTPAGSSFEHYLRDSAAVLERLAADPDARRKIDKATDLIATALAANRPLLVCGNGGSAADAQHLTGELVGRFLMQRRALNVICLSSNPSVLTSIGNDDGFENVFSRQVEAYAAGGGVLLAISTSGKSANVVGAARTARQLGLTVIGLTGAGGGDLASVCDLLLAAPARSTPLVQQAHLVIYHFICAAVERRIAAAPAASADSEVRATARTAKTRAR